MSGLLAFLSSLLAGAAASMGVGGGAVLLLYLTAFAGVGQLAAQGINLIFFLPIAVIAVFIHAKSGLINFKSAVICIVFGLPGIFAGLWLAHAVSEALLGKLFAGLLLVVGLRELFARPARREENGRRHEQPPKPKPKRSDFPGRPWH